MKIKTTKTINQITLSDIEYIYTITVTDMVSYAIPIILNEISEYCRITLNKTTENMASSCMDCDKEKPGSFYVKFDCWGSKNDVNFKEIPNRIAKLYHACLANKEKAIEFENELEVEN